MKIIVIQRHSENLDGIRESVFRLNPTRAEEIVYTSEPAEVLEQVRNAQGEQVLVVSGQILGIYGFEGTDLANAVKHICPDALFYLYSVSPGWCESVDGIIPKPLHTGFSREHFLLAGILASNFNGLLSKDRIKDLFPEIDLFLIP